MNKKEFIKKFFSFTIIDIIGIVVLYFIGLMGFFHFNNNIYCLVTALGGMIIGKKITTYLE